MQITITYGCGHSEEAGIYVSDYTRQTYGRTEEDEAASRISAAAAGECRKCYQASMTRHENAILERNQERDRQIRERTANRVVAATPQRACVGCGAPSSMSASLGPSCPNCYDDLSG